MKESRIWELVISKITALLFVLFLFLYPIPYTLYPIHAKVNIGEEFGLGGITSFGQITSDLVAPTFSIAAALVIIYFLWGAYKFLISGANKEEAAGARQMITHAIIGFIILIFAFFILQFLLSGLFEITGYQIIK